MALAKKQLFFVALLVESDDELCVEDAEKQEGSSVDEDEVENVAVDDPEPLGSAQLTEVEVRGGLVQLGVKMGVLEVVHGGGGCDSGSWKWWL